MGWRKSLCHPVQGQFMPAYIKQGRGTGNDSVVVSVWFTSFIRALRFIIQQIIKSPAVETYVKLQRLKGIKVQSFGM